MPGAVRRLRVGLNARVLSDPRLRGFSRHALGLVRGFMALESMGQESPELHLFTDRPIAAEVLGPLRGIPVHYSWARPHLVWEQLRLAGEARRERIDLLHSTINLGVPFTSLARGIPRVVTIHDLISVRDVRGALWKAGPGAWKGIASFLVSWKAAAGAEAIITVSEHSRREILRDYPDWHRKIHVVPNGVEERFQPGEPDRAVLAKFGITGDYFLYVGGFEARKNVGLLVEACARAWSRLGERKFQLVLTGDRSSASEKLREESSRFPGTRWTGYVEDRELVELYRGAKASVLPSREEGFGLPLLESMACGTPAFSACIASLPEVGGNAVALFDPNDPSALESLIVRAFTDAAWLAQLREKGLARAARFTWREAARRTLEVYRSVIPLTEGAFIAKAEGSRSY